MSDHPKPGSVAEAIAGMLGSHLLHTCGRDISERGPLLVATLQREAELELAVRGLDHWAVKVMLTHHLKAVDVKVRVTRKPAGE